MIDVIVPVYRGAAQTRACLESVLAHREPDCEIVVIDDASPEPAVVGYVDALAREGRVTLLRNESNRGFVQSVNRGMSLHADRDVVLLNSDTEVPAGWLARLAAHAGRNADAATVTPFSNNATICSYPFEGLGGGVPGNLGLAGLDAVFARVNAGVSLAIPTAVGFCMYIRRRALAQLGLFDAERFGRGYGEENDFCMRAAKAGWRHLLAADVYVFHEGSVSFSEDRFALIKASTAALVAAHPDYPARVHNFLETDPVRPLRKAVDLARVEIGHDEAHRVVDERCEERDRLLSGLWHIEKIATQRDSMIGQLNIALDMAATRVADRDKQLAENDALVAELRRALAYAESLAFERQDELMRIRASWAWPIFHRLVRRAARAPA